MNEINNELKQILMLIFLDLDGTLINTVHPDWKPYKDGQKDYPVSQISIFTGVKEFIASRKAKGDFLVIVSDSHPRYANPISAMFANYNYFVSELKRVG